jgi:hypothetical protein
MTSAQFLERGSLACLDLGILMDPVVRLTFEYSRFCRIFGCSTIGFHSYLRYGTVIPSGAKIASAGDLPLGMAKRMRHGEARASLKPGKLRKENSAMKRCLIKAAVAIVVLSLGLTGCTLIPEDLIGTWSMTSGGSTITVTFEPRSMSIDQTSPTGSLSFSVEAIDQSARHIDTTVTSATGAFAGYEIGKQYYWYYELNPDGLYFMFAPSPYPPAVQSGPFTKIP